MFLLPRRTPSKLCSCLHPPPEELEKLLLMRPGRGVPEAMAVASGHGDGVPEAHFPDVLNSSSWGRKEIVVGRFGIGRFLFPCPQF